MSLKRQLLVSFGLQGVGAAAVLLATLVLGARLGPEVQGGFSRIKAEVEFVAAFAMFGLPQALFFYVKSGAMSTHTALRWAFGCALLALPLAAAYALWYRVDDNAVSIALLSLAVAAVVAHGQLRALLLVRERTVWFNVITALPQLLVLLGVLHIVTRGGVETPAWFALFALAFAVAAAISWWRLRAAPRGRVSTGVGWRALGHYGLAAWLTAALATAAILLVQRWVEVAHGRVALGQFAMAMTLVQVPLTPISYAAPLLLRRWMEQPGAAVSRRVAGAVFAALLSAAALVWLAAGAWPDLGLGPAYAGTTQALAVLLAGGAAEAASRVLTVQASASGLPWIAVRAEVARWAVLGVGWLALPAPALLPVCALWAVGAWAAAAVFVWHSRADAQGRPE
ncbi:MAG: hypothetical protein ABI887_12225 [Burkholderiales bacterium]